MQLRGEVELKKTEHFDALEFTVSREESILESVVFPAFALAVLWWFWHIGSLWPRILAGLAAISSAVAYIANRIQGGETRLRISSDGVMADGNLGKLFTTHEQIGIADIDSIRYEPGGDGEISGLLARKGWSSILLLPHITGDQANEIIAAIHRKFPHMPVERYAPFSLSDLNPFDRGEHVTRLGLSDSEKSEAGKDNQVS